MPVSSYIGQYGDSLRRLTALANAQPQALGQADATGALPPQGPMPGGPAGAGPAMQGAPAGALGGAGPQAPQGSAFGNGPPAPAPMPGQGGGGQGGPSGGIGLNHLLDAATHADKEHMADQLESNGVDINKKFGELQDQGFIPQVRKMTRQEKGALLTEFGLRMMAASAQGVDGFQAAGIAGQGLLESIRANKSSREKEALTAANRQQDIALTVGEKQKDRAARTSDVELENKGRADVSAGDNASRERIAAIEAAARIKAAKLEAKRSKQSIQVTDKDGNLRLITPGEDGGEPTVSTPTMEEDTQVPTGQYDRNGKPETKPGKKRVPVKPMQQKADSSMVSAVEREKERLGKDPATMRDLRTRGVTGQAADAELEQRARKNVMSRNGGGDNADPLGIMEQ